MRSALLVGLSSFVAACQTPSPIDQPDVTMVALSKLSDSDFRKIEIGGDERVEIHFPESLIVELSSEKQPFRVTAYESEVLFRVGLGREAGAISCDGRSGCREIEASNPAGNLTYALQELASPRTSADILHPLRPTINYPHAIHALGKLPSGYTIFVEGFCVIEADCVFIAENLSIEVL